jgi:cobaltochelatase CobN
MQQLDLVYFSTTSNELPNMAKAVESLIEQGVPINLRAFTKMQLEHEEGQAEFVRQAMRAHAVVVTLMGGKTSFPAWDDLVAAMKKARANGQAPYFHVQPTGANDEAWNAAGDHADGMHDGSWRELNKYFRHGGLANAVQFMRLLYNASLNADLPVDPVEVPPTEGVYHPDLPGSPPLDEYLTSLDPAKPLIGMWFYQNLWVNGALDHINALIRSIERQGGQALPVFHYRFQDDVVGNKGAGLHH